MRILLIILTAASLSLGDILFEDDFNDGNADDWYEYPTTATYQVNDSLRYEMSYFGTGDDYALSCRGDVDPTTMSVEDYSVRVEVIGHWPTHFAGPEVRLSSDNTSYGFYLDWSLNYCYIGKYTTSGWTTLTRHYSTSLKYDVSYWLRFECEGNTLRAKVWQGTVGDEPPVWLLSCVDYDFLNNGCMALGTGGNYPEWDFNAEFDNVLVTDPLGPAALEQTTWGSIKAAQF
ncbi:MAG: hypothetical protein ABFR50_11450 [Candidatus Fermentibacteria bacterium]